MKPISREILNFLFDYPRTEFTYRELERKTGFSIGTVSTYIKELETLEFVKLRKAANSIFVSLDLDNPLTRQMKRAYNLERMYSSNLVEYLIQKLRPESLIIFGSYSRGEDDEQSDIDIASIGGRNVEIDTKKFEKTLKRRIKITKAKPLSISKEFLNTLANGIVLSGSIYVV